MLTATSENTLSASASVPSACFQEEEARSASEDEDSDVSGDEDVERSAGTDAASHDDGAMNSVWDWSGGMRYPLTEGRLQEEVLGLPTRIVTGDFFSKLQRDRDFGQHTLSLCNDANSVRESMLRLQVEAVERAVAYEEKKERDRLRREEKNEEKRNRLIDEQRQAWELKQRNDAAAALQRIHEQQQMQRQIQEQSLPSGGGAVEAEVEGGLLSGEGVEEERWIGEEAASSVDHV
jgi:hypothetical protein